MNSSRKSAATNRWRLSPVAESFLGLSAVGVGFFAVGAWQNHNIGYWYLLWNLFLAWIPLLAVWAWFRLADSSGWGSWRSIVFGLLWLGFLPNSFYLVTDYIHLQETPRSDLLFDTAMFTVIIITGVGLGMTSLYLVHRQLLRSIQPRIAHGLMAAVLLACSFAIYLGRVLRWNTWDVLVNPAGILFDVSNRLIRPYDHPQTVATTLTYFVLLSALYFACYRAVAPRSHP